MDNSLDKSPGKVKKAVDFRGFYVENFGENGVPSARRARTSAVVIFPFSSISSRRKYGGSGEYSSRGSAAGVFTGRIFEAGTKTGIGDLTVRLIPPRDVKKPEKVTTTDEDGKFRFTDLGADKYLLEVYQGLTLLYREVIEGKENTPKEIALKKK